MCGFAGILQVDGRQLPFDTPAVLRRMGQVIAHRGPDDVQQAIEGPFGVEFRRLSIVDVVGGSQPMTNEDASLTMVVNGEIYNHVELRRSLREPHAFRTSSDCEVILHLYEERGIRFLDSLIGMYAIALWDRRKRELLLARDRFGIKPLYYARAGQQLLFGSEVKALLQHPECPRGLDWDAALSDPWMSGDVSTLVADPASYFSGIEHLPGGTYVSVAADGGDRPVERTRYWSVPRCVAAVVAQSPSEGEYIERYGELLRDSVHKCLMSDVEFGVALSGGIDSAGVCALASEVGGGFHTFTVLSRSTLGNDDAKYAHLNARALRLPNHQVAFTWAGDQTLSVDHWRHLLWQMETPLCGAEHLYKYHLYRFVKAIRPGLKVMLTGQGSDEFNGGYSSLFAPPESPDWSGFLDALEYLEHGALMASTGVRRIAAWEARLGQPLFARDYLCSRSTEPIADDAWQNYIATKARDLQIFNLWHEDRTAAASSIENRVPFLDHRLVELSLSVPPALRAALLWDKGILRRALRGVLPAEVRERPKTPFFHGPDVRHTYRLLADLMAADGGALVEEAFAPPSGMSAVIDRDRFAAAVARAVEDREGTQSEILLRLINMGLLDGMARKAAAPKTCETPVLPSLSIDDWERDEARVLAALGGYRAEAGCVFRLAADTCLVRREAPHEEWYVLVAGQIQFAIRETSRWLEVLRRFDGDRSLADILAALELDEEEIASELRMAVEHGIVVIAQPASQPTR